MTILDELEWREQEVRRLRKKLKTYRRLLRLQTIIKGNINARLEKEYGKGFNHGFNDGASFEATAPNP